ncbi:MAG TPA: hypothetical protein VNK23_08165 [Candidatus Dormibacteraeota bacterium]|nr:hypothetical protein [Candidatus Dormibacteraeota bacterium]
MASILARIALRGAAIRARRRTCVFAMALFAPVAVTCAGCSRLKPVDTKALDSSGMGYGAVQQLTALKITPAEVSQIAEARQGGFSDDDCVAIMKIYRGENRPFDAGDAVAGLTQVGMSDTSILNLAKLNELGLGWGELQAMKLAGMSDAIVMGVARRRAAGKPVLSGASLARLKNAGVREPTLFQLVERGVPDSQAGKILAYRRRGASERQILRQFAGI